jgi:hypothetical protein
VEGEKICHNADILAERMQTLQELVGWVDFKAQTHKKI